MKIVGIGTDMVSTARIAAIWQRFGRAFARRILTKSEWEDLAKSRHPIGFLAKRYAAKEAVAKAIGTGFRAQGILLTEIGVSNDALGRPYLQFIGGTAAEMLKKGVTDSHVSLSDEKEFALAFVILTAG